MIKKFFDNYKIRNARNEWQDAVSTYIEARENLEKKKDAYDKALGIKSRKKLLDNFYE